MSNPKDISNFVQKYCKSYYAGAFSAPIPSEIAKMSSDDVIDLRRGEYRTVVIGKTITRDSKRKDFTGGQYAIPEGSRIATHIARTPNAPVPDLSQFHYITTYVEDDELTASLRAQGRQIVSTNVSSASEIIALWGLGTEQSYDPADAVTVGRVRSVEPDTATQIKMLSEIETLAGWDDDYPYYSDGSWSALSLRGFYVNDPTKGVKPAEMPKKWKMEHPDDLALECQWTILAEQTPTIMQYVESVASWSRLERVRLLQMEGRDGRGGALRRHSDITDRAAGTRDGQIARFHIPIRTHSDIKMTTWDLDGTRRDIHLGQGECWYLDQRKPHAVTNPTGVDRVHLVVDVLADDAVRDLIVGSQ
jgi:hypothetical protein